MILPKEFMEKIEYFEHSFEHLSSEDVYDVFTLHFKAWWRRKRTIKIRRINYDHNEETGVFKHKVTPSAADLYNQLHGWSVSTFDEKLESITHKYETNETDNVITLKPKPKDMDNGDSS